MPRRRVATVLALLACTAGLSACGNKESYPTRGEDEGTEVSVGPLQYQVQISRQLNPTNVEDSEYLTGLQGSERKLAGNQVFFAVFLRVDNARKTEALSANTFSITDTQGNTFQPLALPAENPYGYKPLSLPRSGVDPPVDSTAYDGPAGGSLLLFKLPVGSLDNRPLILKISKPGAKPGAATVVLDV